MANQVVDEQVLGEQEKTDTNDIWWIKGTVRLSKPLLVSGKDIETIDYDFSKVTGDAYLQVMSANRDHQENTYLKGTGTITAKQAFGLFCHAAIISKADMGALQRLSLDDTLVAERLGGIFFTNKVLAAAARIITRS